ncbi:MAG: SWIM zinc finger domain-containing protein [Rubrobacteraceae bacterium]
MATLAGVLTRGALVELAGERYFERGEQYDRDGLARIFAEHDGTVTARVAGTYEYRVKLQAAEDELRYSCTCPLGADGEFCKHCVAAGLAWLGQARGSGAAAEPVGATTDEVRAYLGRQSREALVEILLDRAEEDELLRERLLLRAASEKPGGPDTAAFNHVIEDALDPGGFLDYGSGWEYTQRVDGVIESLSGLLDRGFADEAVGLAEYALGVAEGAMEYDSGGHVSNVARDLEDLHLAACERARPEPEALARRLFEWEMRGPYDTFFGASETYAGVLGERGLAEYRRLAGEEWSSVSGLGPGERDPEGYGRRSRIARVMETLARRSEDVDELVAVKSRDLSRDHTYLEIAELYRQAGRRDEAFGWAERGVVEFPDPDPRLREFLAREYSERGRPEEAMEVMWEEFATRPHLANYRKLKSCTERLEDWAIWREKALDRVREQTAALKESRWFRADNSTLVGILLWERHYDEAWREAVEGGCSPGLWLELAAARERDHPEDAISVYRDRIEDLIDQKNKESYREARDFILKVRELMRRTGREPEFAAYLESVRAAHRRKRNLMALLEGIE